MKRFQFRLDTLLRLREVVRDERRTQLADAFRVEAVLQEQLDEVGRGIDAARQSQRAPAGAVDVDRLMAGQRYELALTHERGQLERQKATVLAEIEQRRQALLVADQEVHVLEKLREKQRERHVAATAASEMKELDEIASRSHFFAGAHQGS